MKRILLNCFLLLALGLLFLPGPVLAQGTTPSTSPVKVLVGAGDSPLEMQGWIGEADRFTGDMRLTAEGDIDIFTFLATDLKQKDGTHKVTRKNIAFTGDTTLQAGVPKDFQVVITGVDFPGVYEGNIILLQPGQALADALTIPLQLTAQERPSLTLLAGSEQLQLSLVNCVPGLECWLAHLLLPDSAFIDERVLQVDNSQSGTASLVSAKAILLGQETGYQLNDTQVSLPEGPLTFTGQAIHAIPVTIRRAQIPPDQYTGTIYLTLDQATDKEKVPVTLNVRVGPLLPILFLIVGILIGQLLRYMQNRGDALAKSLEEADRAYSEVRSESVSEDDRKHLTGLVENVREKVYLQRVNLDEVRAQLTVVRDRSKELVELRSLELAAANLNGQKEQVLRSITRARGLVYLARDQEAKTLIQTLYTQVIPQPAPDVANTLEDLGSISFGGVVGDETLEGEKLPKEKSGQDSAGGDDAGQPRSGWQRLVAWMQNQSLVSDVFIAEATYRVVPKLLYVLLLIGLLYVGMGTFYVTNGAHFGASPYNDFLGLILWGLSADVASRTLSNLTGAKPAA